MQVQVEQVTDPSVQADPEAALAVEAELAKDPLDSDHSDQATVGRHSSSSFSSRCNRRRPARRTAFTRIFLQPFENLRELPFNRILHRPLHQQHRQRLRRIIQRLIRLL